MLAGIAGVSAFVFFWTWLMSIVLSVSVARAKNQSGLEWFAAALLAGPLALIAVAGMPVAPAPVFDPTADKRKKKTMVIAVVIALVALIVWMNLPANR